MLLMLIQIVDIILTVLWWFIIAQAVMSWLIAFNVINTHNDFVAQLWMMLDRITEPLYRPFRRIMPDFGGLDLTPMLVLILIIIIQGPVLGYLARLAYSSGMA
ncbi:YggT family protein [Sphingopyxis terrae]|uniref:YggT family protein n=3 Tax=Sphingomonadaceae TaxID=41297 RepID=A0A1Y6ES57_9SPHN|nr:MULTISPECIES: YggT family protein [Sphingopyxis]AMU94933.1 osmotic-shock protein [Sphingopyxis terrae subsp. terrae NBRC 15098]KAB2858392.1 MAG: YggT family protein [Sphingopyxis terrae]MBD3747121.1 YggT family protein [Sphingopyxis terrae]MBN8803945.1 YggT family protein [Sphingopyxis terrae]MBU7589438.1 YggT family protein [Sphingopyxis terrae]